MTFIRVLGQSMNTKTFWHALIFRNCIPNLNTSHTIDMCIIFLWNLIPIQFQFNYNDLPPPNNFILSFIFYRSMRINFGMLYWVVTSWHLVMHLIWLKYSVYKCNVPISKYVSHRNPKLIYSFETELSVTIKIRIRVYPILLQKFSKRENSLNFSPFHNLWSCWYFYFKHFFLFRNVKILSMA